MRTFHGVWLKEKARLERKIKELTLELEKRSSESSKKIRKDVPDIKEIKRYRHTALDMAESYTGDWIHISSVYDLDTIIDNDEVRARM